MSGFVRRIPAAGRAIASRLAQIDIELTERCDNDCIHCCINLPVGDAGARDREMSAGQVLDMLRQAADLGCLRVRFTGGEPLLRTDFDVIYEGARRLGLAVLLLTNARRLTPALADLLARIPPREPVEVTAYGMRRESYEAVSRAPGSFAQFRRGVDLLRERRIPFVVRGALLPPNRAEIDEFEAWAESIPWMTAPPRYSMFFDLRSRRDDPTKNRLIETLRLSPEEGLAVLSRDASSYRAEIARFGDRLAGPPGPGLFQCGAGRGLSVDAYGRVQSCMGVRASDLTVDAQTSSLGEALDGFAALRETRATDPEYLRRCALCFLHGLCEQCPAKSWSEHGTLDGPVDYLCDVAHAQARLMGWLDHDEKAWEVADWETRVRSRPGRSER